MYFYLCVEVRILLLACFDFVFSCYRKIFKMVRNCSLKNCNNSVKKKYHFFVLPSPLKVAKRAEWLKKCGHLLPEDISQFRHIALCEGHFEADQFESFGSNRRNKLKPTAVPTIFVKNPPRIADRMKLKEEPLPKKSEEEYNEDSDHEIVPSETLNLDSITDRLGNENNPSDGGNLIVVDPSASEPVFDSQENRKYCQMNVDTFGLRRKVHELEMERDAALGKYRSLARKIETMEGNLKLFLNHDQIRFLKSENSRGYSTCWSPETLQKCSKLLNNISLRSYEYLRVKEHYPLPSYRTLNRHQLVSKYQTTKNHYLNENVNTTIDEVATSSKEEESELENDVEDDEVDNHEHTDFEILETDDESEENFEQISEKFDEGVVDSFEEIEIVKNTEIIEYDEIDPLDIDFFEEISRSGIS